MLWVRSFDSLAARPLAGTEGGQLVHSGRRTAGALGFFADGKLKTLEVSGGPAAVVADAPDMGEEAGTAREPSCLCQTSPKACTRWRPQAAPRSPFSNWTRPNTCISLWPKFLPDGKHFLYLRYGLLTLRLAGLILPPWTEKKIDSCLREAAAPRMPRASCSTFATGH